MTLEKTLTESAASEALYLSYGYLLRKAKESNIDELQVRKALQSILSFNYLNNGIDVFPEYPYDVLQDKISSINELSDYRKKRGVFYTPPDVVDFILLNCTNAYINRDKTIQIGTRLSDSFDAAHFCNKVSFFDPTCGAGEFLVGVLRLKINIWENSGLALDLKTLKTFIKTIRGNDINPESCAISKLRLFLEIAHSMGLKQAIECSSAINKTMTSLDFIDMPDSFKERFGIIVGNPPYVEDVEYGDHSVRYGNVYCNVLQNSRDCLKRGGVMGFVVPLSYVSTPRMEKIRSEIKKCLPVQYILSYADRPDCLFKKVHQKLCILIASSSGQPAIYTSSYQYWYKNERESLFDSVPVVENVRISEKRIPKLGSQIALEIFDKIISENNLKLFDISREGDNIVCINRRETFWMKVFRYSMQHPEFKEFYFEDRGSAAFCYCLLNSSLFWWYWVCVSDCWHVSKELNDFMVPCLNKKEEYSELADALELKLEATKKYVGTKQTEYEYKHAECYDLITLIDERINRLYGLTPRESDYIKNFALAYRMSLGRSGCEKRN